MTTYVQKVEATGIYGRFDIEQEFFPGVNVLYGMNGSGKTTLLHILANAMNGDYERFAFLEFDRILVVLSDETEIALQKQDRVTDILLNNEKIGSFSDSEIKNLSNSEYSYKQKNFKEWNSISTMPCVEYFPAFRDMIETWSSRERPSVFYAIDSERYDHFPNPTPFARKLFGEFVPRLTYPSPTEIEKRLTQEVQNARIQVGMHDRELLTQAFKQIYEVLDKKTQLDESPEQIIQDIQSLSNQLKQSSSLYETESFLASSELQALLNSVQLSPESSHMAAPILDVYRTSLKKMVEVQTQAFAAINQYLSSVNKFLDGKRLDVIIDETSGVKRQKHPILLVFDDTTTSRLRALSSGERQIVTMIYAATHMREEAVVLIDEPEISLHIDWQRLLIPEMEKQLGERQIIACTHSPFIGSHYDLQERLFELQANPTKRSFSTIDTPEEADCDDEDI